MSTPLVSILMNCYNGEKYLEVALKSVFDQTYKNWELVFWDNLSSDKSEEILKRFKDPRVKYFKSDIHTSQYEARNKGIEKCEGDILAFLDVDDFWLPEKLEQQIKLFQHSNIGFSCKPPKIDNRALARARAWFSQMCETSKIHSLRIIFGNFLHAHCFREFCCKSPPRKSSKTMR